MRDAQHVWSTVQPYGPAIRGRGQVRRTSRVLHSAGVGSQCRDECRLRRFRVSDAHYHGTAGSHPHEAGRPGEGDSSGTYADVVLSDVPLAYWRLGESNARARPMRPGTNPGAVFRRGDTRPVRRAHDGNPRCLFDDRAATSRPPTPYAPGWRPHIEIGSMCRWPRDRH